MPTFPVSRWRGLRWAAVAALGLGAAVPGSALAVTEPVALAARPCGDALFSEVRAAPGSCTHGPDPAPPGVDHTVPRPLASSEPSPTSAPGLGSPFPCYGDGQSGNRVHAIYARPDDGPDRFDQVLPSIMQWARDAEAVIARSASQTGGIRHVRWVTTADCQLLVTRVAVSSSGDDTFEATVAELAAQGYNRADRKYLVWMDSTVLCGIGNYYLDDRAGQGNFNNGVPQAAAGIARVDSGCWGLGARGQSVEAHELVHTLGGVQPSAPNATAMGHCTDDSDRMCYADGSPGAALQTRCATDQEAYLDCGKDDYFHTSPPADSYLATHWNVASSSFLASADTPPPGSEKLTRLAGPDRIATSVVASANAFPNVAAARAVVLANAGAFADALAGVPLARATGGPLLLTGKGALDARVAAELDRVLPPRATVHLLGGTGALSDAVQRAVEARGFRTLRYAGVNRYATAVAIAEQGLGNPNTLFEVTGTSFPDALAAGAAAAATSGAVLLTDGSSLPPETAAYLATRAGATRYALGGPAAAADPTATAVAGADRYQTAVMVAQRFFGSVNTVGVASGRSFADALSGGANIATRNGPVVLAPPTAPLPSSVGSYLRDQKGIERVLLYGGRAVLGDDVAYAIAASLSP